MRKGLAELRESAGYSRDEISKIINVTRITYCKYEQGSIKIRNMKAGTLIRLALALNVSCETLISLDDGGNER